MKMEKSTKGITKIHNVRFYNMAPRSINCFSYNNQLCKLALSRNDSSIEIWDFCHAPFLEKTIPGDANSTVEDMVWSKERLFSVGLTGEVCEWNLSNLTKKRSQLVTGSAIWCIDVNTTNTNIALGTEEGFLNIFDIEDDDLSYKNVCDKQEGRILCCKYDKTGEFLVSGSVDAIRIWSTKSGLAIRKITLGRTEAKRETIVWSLQVLADLTIISGDSRGQVTVWDGKLGVQVESHQALKADVLAVTVNEDENILLCAGIDPVIRIYALTDIKKDNRVTKKWVKFFQRNVHDHDVKALICSKSRIISGGVDGYVGVSSFPRDNKGIRKYGPFLQPPCASLATDARLILLRYSKYLELWKLGTADKNVQLGDDKNDIRKLLAFESGPEKLLEMRSKNDESIVAAVISPDGQWLAYSTRSTIRLFFLGQDQNTMQMKISRIKDVPVQFQPSHKILFSSNSRTVFLIKLTNQVDIFDIISTTEIDYVETIDTTKVIKDLIHLAEISNCGRYFVAAGTCRKIGVWMRNKKQWKHFLNLPKYVAPTSAIAIHQHIPRVVAAFTDGKIFEYDLDEMRFTFSANQKFVENSHTHCVNNIVLDPRNENVIVLHNDSRLFVLEKTNNKSKSSSKLGRLEDEETVPGLKLKFERSYEHFVHLAWLSENEVVVVGVNPVSLIEQLPGALWQKKFGVM